MKVKQPPFYNILFELRTILEGMATVATLPVLHKFPQGDGHPVIVLPGFMTNDTVTNPLVQILKKLNYNAYNWGYGVNIGCSDGLIEYMNWYIDYVYKLNDLRSISLIGWSLGGPYAKLIAQQHPDMIRNVIGLGSPFVYLLNGTSPGYWHYLIAKHFSQLVEMIQPWILMLKGTAVEWCNVLVNERFKEQAYSPDMIDAWREPPPVPTTSIYSSSDGIVNPECCLLNETQLSENIEVPSSHCGFGWNPLVTYIITERLSQPEGEWKKFDKKDKVWKKLLID